MGSVLSCGFVDLDSGAGGTFCFAEPIVLIVLCRLTLHPALSLEVVLLLVSETPRSQCVLPTDFYFINFRKP